MADRVIVSDLIAQVAYIGGEDGADGVQVSGLTAQTAYTGGGGEPNRVDVAAVTAQVAHIGGLTLADGVYISDLIMQVAYVETYPNIPLTGYSPRLLVDILFASGIQRFTTEDTYVEEI